jgi:tetratricopeptide (TPR) repeat protein
LPHPAAKKTSRRLGSAELLRAPVGDAPAPLAEVLDRHPSSNGAAEAAPRLSLLASDAKPDALLASAYAAYQVGNTIEASRLYRQVLRDDAMQRDAWLGLAVIAHADNQREPALEAYKRVLRLEPQNATALAGVNSLNRQAGEPQQESRLRELLARSPEEPDLNHSLGLVLSAAQRWSEAQPLFFKAYQLAPQEPRFAYNLAVTLDHLRKPSLALHYYETALQLAQDKNAGFDEPSARRRLTALRGDSAPRSSK